MTVLHNKKFIFFILFCAVILTLYLTLRVDAPNYDLKFKRHTSIIDNNAEYPYKYRLVNPFITQIWFSVLNIFISEKAAFLGAYFIQNFLVFLFLFYTVFKFFSLWFDTSGTVIAALLFAFIIPLTLTGYDTLGDMTTAGLMALSFYFINTGRHLWLFTIVFFGAFNELQIILIVMFYFFSRKKNFTDSKVWLNCILLIVTFLIAYAIIYLLRGGNAGSNDLVWYFTKDAAFNIANKDWIILWLLTLVPLLIFAIKTIADKPEFLRRSLFIVLPLFYLGAFFFIARLREMDKALTIFLILIPLALLSVFPAHVNNKKN